MNGRDKERVRDFPGAGGRRAGGRCGNGWERERETGMERHQSCCRLEFLGRRKRAAGMRSVCLCHSGGPGSPDQALLPCRLSSHWANAQHRLHHRGTTQLRRTESRASHHTVQTVPLLASLPSGPGFRAGLGGRSCVSVTHGTVRQCDHSTAFPRLQHQTGTVFVERKRYNNLTSCRPLNVARHARAVHCNAMHSSEQDLGGRTWRTWPDGQTREPCPDQPV